MPSLCHPSLQVQYEIYGFFSWGPRTNSGFFVSSLNSQYSQPEHLQLHALPVRLPKLAIKPWIRPDPQPLIRRNARVVDPAVCDILPLLQDVKFEKGHIEWIAPSSTFDSDSETADSNNYSGVIRIVDLQGRYLCPLVYLLLFSNRPTLLLSFMTEDS